MTLFSLLGLILVAGLILWAIQALPIIAEPMKKMATILIIVVVALILIGALFGVPFGNLGNTRIGR